MKKLLVSCAVLLSAAMFMSCDNYNPKGLHCWEIHTIVYEYVNVTPSQETTQYFWGTKKEAEEEAVTIMEQLEASGQEYYRVSFEPTIKSQADCH